MASELAQHFLALHERRSEPLLLVNVWDLGSARLMESLGFEALATTSSGHAASLGRLDGSVSRDEALSHGRERSHAVELPVSGDFENGFAHEPDEVAERARKIGGSTLRSIGDIARHQRLKDNDEESVTPKDMLSELSSDNLELTRSLRSAHKICERHDDVATASLIEVWIDQTERRTWFLSETARQL